ncbi:hypothetical protein R1sor_013507 [Riccia sorocarpa]|uniref:Uncharacterized protein n=1 Tax=Riccia sorocarpa TaxID=122646 RepID=A0ABD3H6S7_9MARC
MWSQVWRFDAMKVEDLARICLACLILASPCRAAGAVRWSSTLDSFTCNVWEKAHFITYYEDVETQRPVAWLFYTGMFEHVITFEEGAVLSDPYWQAPEYCFTNEAELQGASVDSSLILPSKRQQEPLRRWFKGLSS